MILAILLLIVFTILAVVTVLAICIGGSLVIVVFGDAIVCVIIIGFIIKKIRKGKKNKGLK